MVQALVATGCILTAHRCGLLPQVVEGTLRAGDLSCLFGVNGSLREAFGGVGWSLGTSFGGRGGDGSADRVNIIASCKASVAAARAVVSPVDETGKGTGPTTSSPSVT